MPPNLKLRNELSKKSLNELQSIYNSYLEKNINQVFDTKRRLIRAIEILKHKKLNNLEKNNVNLAKLNFITFGIKVERLENRRRITDRLKFRMKNGLIEEVEFLLNNHLTYERLDYFGLEYKFIGKYLKKEIEYDKMLEKLNIAIHQFSKRQGTFFRHMEKHGVKIHWIEKPYIKKIIKILEN